MSLPPPTPITTPWAISGTRNVVPVAPPSSPANAASYQTGFPLVTATAENAGGLPPLWQDVQGALYDVTTNLAQQWAGQYPAWNSSVAASNGGYQIGAVLTRADGTGFWLNTLANNAGNPDAEAAGWVPLENYGYTILSGLVSGVVFVGTPAASKGTIILQGALAGNLQVVLPNTLQLWLIVNQTTGSHSATVKTASGSGVIIPQSGSSAPQFVWGDGTNIYPASGILYGLTKTEIAASLVPANPQFCASPYRDPRRDAVTGNGSTDDTTTMQAHLTFVYSYSGWSQLPEAFHIATTAGLLVTFNGNRYTNALKIVGVTNVSSTFNEIAGGTAPLLSLTGPSTSIPYEAGARVEDVGFFGQSYSAIGLQLRGLGLFTTYRVQAIGLLIGIADYSALEGKHVENIVESNVIGYNFEQYGTNSGANAVAVEGGSASGNTFFGMILGGSSTDIGLADALVVEGNGTGGAATGGSTTTLIDTTKAWAPGTLVGAQLFVTISGTQYAPTVTANTNNTLTFAAIAAAVVSGDNYYLGGGVVIRTGFSGTYGFTTMRVRGIHFEDNYGYALGTQTTSGLNLSVEDSLITGAGVGGLCVNIQGGGVQPSSLYAKNCQSPASGDTWNLSCQSVELVNCFISVINDTSLYSTWSNIYTAGGGPFDSRPNPFTLTLAGGIASAPLAVLTKQVCKTITVILQTGIDGTGVTVTSNSFNGGTLPALLWPSVQRVATCNLIVNNVAVVGTVVINTDGTFTFSYPSITNGQINGVNVTRFTYDL